MIHFISEHYILIQNEIYGKKINKIWENPLLKKLSYPWRWHLYNNNLWWLCLDHCRRMDGTSSRSWRKWPPTIRGCCRCDSSVSSSWQCGCMDAPSWECRGMDISCIGWGTVSILQLPRLKCSKAKRPNIIFVSILKKVNGKKGFTILLALYFPNALNGIHWEVAHPLTLNYGTPIASMDAFYVRHSGMCNTWWRAIFVMSPCLSFT